MVLLASLNCLSPLQRASLLKGQITTVADLFLNVPNDIAKKCKITPLEVQQILNSVCNEGKRDLVSFQHVSADEKFTTGDSTLDDAFGGGIRTGMLWEIAGESAAGKTQLALQLSLSVQLPSEMGGILGSTCYLTTSSKLPTSRLHDIIQTHSLLSPEFCSLDDIQTTSTADIPKLIFVLSHTLPDLIAQRLRPNAGTAALKPIKLIVIDALAELFHSSSKTTKDTLVERSKSIVEISTLLHKLASTHGIAILVLNEVSDVFDRGHQPPGSSQELVYSDQSRWFNRAHSIPGEDRKEANLGLVWANQINVRIILSRTGRRRYLSDAEMTVRKHRRVEEGAQSSPSTSQLSAARMEDQATLIRRLSVIFSSVSRPTSLDYVVTTAGISMLPDEFKQPETTVVSSLPTPSIPSASVGTTVPAELPHETGEFLGGVDPPGDDYDQYWDDDDIPEELYSNS